MARIPYFDRESATGRAAKVYEKLPNLNIFRMLGHSGDMIDGFIKLGNEILIHGELDPVLREIAIVRTGVLRGSSYEVYQHEEISRKIGMSDELIKAIHEGPDAKVFDETQRQVMRFTDDVVKNTRASDATFNPLAEKLGYKQLQELVITIGFYTLVSNFLETFDVDIEDAGHKSGVKLPGMKG
ncbi:carboxymuconolactone decarboxylase family protein [Parvibaculum sp.]|jgi:4-carboxymuconolactone decarboxylase|uniref:carboxymuconolactone decarboxylase family protein n=2 Tax=Parvibaculum sp. TaxID=2024848 RepID=UPI001B082681|nr:carboxymuconolactone decarboxylase family protein [Parvibaculum sp.]MBO6677048.1 carboxymuconolactone decarboxylase family protein [Parvibaculum sp.]MBO6685975.1 carboxymuconolactone decarboxylase family protein [Parvibaculum sp.]MBO6904377.1 carboxymuconolactone decarboxylase family protein [Parvibaculum sp.]